MSFENRLKKLMEQINDFKATADNSLPQNTFYLNEKDILCCERESGISRFPYDADGLVLWARSNGHIDAYESTFTIFKELNFSEDANISFIGGIKTEGGEFFPVSVFDCDRQAFEPFEIKRYVVYSFRYAYYIADTENVTFAVRVHVSRDKHIHLAYTTINKTDKPQQVYMLSYIDAWLFYRNVGGPYDVMNRFAKISDNRNFMIRSYEDCMLIARGACGKAPDKEYLTTAKSGVLGAPGRHINNAACLKNGEFINGHTATNSSDTPVCADCAHYTLDGNGLVRREYELVYRHSLKELEPFYGLKPDFEKIDSALTEDDNAEYAKFENMKTNFANFKGDINPNVLNKFVRNIQKQVSLCALGKNYAGAFMGVRDVMQQLESSLIWQSADSRRQFITALNYILEDGRPPRQYSVSSDPDTVPDFDLRKFIDQGVWIITTLHTYLSYTDDWSILDEKCGYFVANQNNTAVVAKSKTVDTVLDHIVKIMDFLCSNVDETTGCLHSLFGDWNDALDGLGRTADTSREFGTGCSVMASLQLYQNCREICEILEHTAKYTEKIVYYKKIACGLKEGLAKYAVDTAADGKRRIMHGWGDKMSYKIGSWHDPDGKSRVSCTANSFWAISDMIKNDPSMKQSIMESFKCLDSTYGIMTFDKAFPKDMHKYVGRISNITAGTYENAGTYVHATMFAVSALFLLGESEEAWRQFILATVLSHQNCTKSPFVMPNSYFKNDDWCIDGYSFFDWYTGSGTVFIKNLIKFGFGVCPTLDGLVIQTAASMPTTDASLNIVVKGHPITVKYTDTGSAKRSFKLNGKAATGVFDSLMNTEKLFIPTAELTDGTVIEIID